MKSSNPHYNIFDYTLCNDHVLYPSINYEVKTHLPKQNIGIFILEVKDWEEFNQTIIELYRYSLIDSFSVQISIDVTIKIHLIMKIICLGANELNYRYTNLKKHLKKKGTLSLMQGDSLETTYLSILNSMNCSNLEDSVIYREKQRYYIFNQEKIKNYFLLVNLNVLWISQNLPKIIPLIELLHAANLKCFLVFFSRHLGDTSQSNYYLFANHPNSSYFMNQIKEKLNQCSYTNEFTNIFHPEFLGRIFTRGPIGLKYIQNTTLPPILNLDLILPPQIPRMKEINSINTILKEFPHEYHSEGYYEMYNGKLILFSIKKLNIMSIRNISQNLNSSFEKCVIFFENQSDFHIFNKKMDKNTKTKKTVAISDLKMLRKILEEFKMRKSGLEISLY